MVIVLKNSQQLRLPEHELHQMKPAHVPAWIGEELMKPHPSLRSGCDMDRGGAHEAPPLAKE